MLDAVAKRYSVLPSDIVRLSIDEFFLNVAVYEAGGSAEVKAEKKAIARMKSQMGRRR